MRELARAEAYYDRMHRASMGALTQKKLVRAGYPEPRAVVRLSGARMPQTAVPVVDSPVAPRHIEQLLHLEETAELMGRHPSALRYMVHKGTAPPSGKIEGRRMLKLSEVTAWVDAQFPASQNPG